MHLDLYSKNIIITKKNIIKIIDFGLCKKADEKSY